jgi:hypothetical protein
MQSGTPQAGKERQRFDLLEHRHIVDDLPDRFLTVRAGERLNGFGEVRCPGSARREGGFNRHQWLPGLQGDSRKFRLTQDAYFGDFKQGIEYREQHGKHHGPTSLPGRMVQITPAIKSFLLQAHTTF